MLTQPNLKAALSEHTAGVAAAQAEIDALNTQINDLVVQLDALRLEQDGHNQTRAQHQSALDALKNGLYADFQATFVANPNATSYEELGVAMDTQAAAEPPPEEPPPEEPPPEEPPPEEPPPEEP